uniref:BZIP domain-containing protein n=1 Tax=Globodera pallida TaxID=36090 RepID=A0A183BLA5_GLOPA
MLANASVGWLPPEACPSLFYSPVSDHSGGSFESVLSHKSPQQQHQMGLPKNEANLAVAAGISPSFASGNANIGPCPSHVLPHPAAFHPMTAQLGCPSSSYPTTNAAYQTPNAFGIPTGGALAMMAPSAGDRPRTSSKKKPKPVPEERKDEAYRERRRKNNDSARRSREQRRRKEDDTQVRNTDLEKENADLHHKMQLLMLEVIKLQQFYERHKSCPWP